MESQNEIIYLIVLVSVAFFFLFAFFIGLIGYLKRKRIQFFLEKERDQLQFQEQLLLVEAEITEQNLKNVSWELHDNIGQLLSIASIELSMLVQNEMVESKDLLEIKSLIKNSIEQVRSLSKTLNTDVIQSFGIIRMIEIELKRLERLNLIQTSFTHPDVVEIDQKKEVIIFRMIQEFINNTLKHAEASLLEIKIEQENEYYIINAIDNGIGFDKKNAAQSSGLINFEKRANLIEGQLSFNTSPGEGTHLSLKI